MEFSLEVELFHSFQLLLQLRENIAQDQEKSDASISDGATEGKDPWYRE